MGTSETARKRVQDIQNVIQVDSALGTRLRAGKHVHAAGKNGSTLVELCKGCQDHENVVQVYDAITGGRPCGSHITMKPTGTARALISSQINDPVADP